MLAGVVWFVTGCSNKDAELAVQRQKELEVVRAELEQAKVSTAAQETELARLRKDNLELLRLRNEIRQLRDDKQQLARQAQTAQVAAQRAQAQATELAEAEKQRLAVLNQQAEYEARIKAVVNASGGETSPQGQATLACINNLRQIDGAMQQWALENKKDATAIPTAKHIGVYLKDGVIPKCPAGGTYTLNSVGTVPTCTIPGHALP